MLIGDHPMPDKVLFVDDEPSVLEGYKRILYKDFTVDTAVGGEAGLDSLIKLSPYAVVVSDMQMPGMNGAQFLAQVRQRSPDTVRMLLTGHADLDAAMDAVNQGNIFRFLTKPCDKEVLVKAISAGMVQYRLVMAEKELLEDTLMGSIKVLTEVLSAASPEAFGRSMRIARYVRHLVEKRALPAQWRFEAAAMLSQLGCVMLDPELIRMSYMGDNLSPEDRMRFAEHPQVAKSLLIHIPRLEPVAWMISQQLCPKMIRSGADVPTEYEGDILIGAEILRLAVAIDSLRIMGLSHEQAIGRLQDRRAEYEKELIEALAGMKPDTASGGLRKVPSSQLTTGMILQQEIKTKSGMLVVPKGQEITQALLLKLDNYSRAGTISKEIMVLVPD